MLGILENRQNLYNNLIADGYFRGDDGEVNFSFEEFCDALNDQENACNFFHNMVEDGYFRDENGELSLSEEDFLTMIGSVRPKQDFYPITENQRGVLIDWEMNRDTTQYNVPDVRIMKGADAKKLHDALVKVVNAHPYLKTHFVKHENDVMQIRRDEEPVEILMTTLTEKPDSDFFQCRVRPFDLYSDTLYRLEIYTYLDDVYLFTDFHHSIFDGASSLFFFTDMEKAYQGEDIEQESYTAFDYALDEQQLLQSERYTEAENYFKQLLEGRETAVYPHSENAEATTEYKLFLTVEGSKITKFCQQHGLTPNSYFLTALMHVLHTVTREEDIVITTINNGRSDIRAMGIMGMFVKTIPVASSSSYAKMHMADAAQKMQEQLLNTQSRDFYPFTKLVELYGIRPEIMYAFQPSEHSLDEDRIVLSLNQVKMPLFVNVMLQGDDYSLELQYDISLYSGRDMLQLASMLKQIFETAITSSKLCETPLMSPSETERIINLSRGEQLEVDLTQTFPSLFMCQAMKTPSALAVVDEAGSYTYEELNALSGALAVELRQLGVGSNESSSPFVSIMLGYQKEFLVAAIGIEKAGGAYVPLDYDYPNDRLLYMLEDSESLVLITSHAIYDEKTAGGDTFTAKTMFFIDDFIEAIPDSEDYSQVNYATPDGLAYMIYTSGSTGRPKGVMIPHRAKTSFVSFIVREWRLSSQSHICCHSSFSFDASVEDLYPVLTVGGTCYTVPREVRKEMILLYDFIVKNGITGSCLTTQLGQLLLQLYPDLPVDYIAIGGEKMTIVPDCQCRLINHYGPTEFTVASTFYEVQHDREYKNIPIGRPLYNQTALVVDAEGRLLPQGMPGELCMVGSQIATGYWHREELTAEKFTPCPFLDTHPLMYHTGDLVRYNEEGDIEYLGRIDSQVKLRGFRIELGEIETLIASYDGIQMVSVQVREVGGIQHLCAYYSADRQIDVNSLKEYLSEQLTDYMVPDIFMQLDKLPLTPNGKVNRQALPLPQGEVDELVEPVTKTEKAIFAVLAEMLKHNHFGITSNLISMGLTSLTAMRFSVAAYNEFKVQVTVKDVMQHPTIQQLAALIDSKREEETQDGQQAELQDDQHNDAPFWPEGKFYYNPITENQRGVLIDWEMNRDTTQYNIPVVRVMKGADAMRLHDALVKVVDAHPYLKTCFVQHEGDVMQIRRDENPVEILMTTLTEKPDAAFFQQRVRPFDLYHDTLYRFEIYTYHDDVYLFMDIHHSIYDGASSIFLHADIKKAYQGEDIEQEVYTAFDFALDELRLKKSERFAEAEQYFRQLLEDHETAVYPRSAMETPYSAQEDPSVTTDSCVSVAIEGPRIAEFCRQQGLTPNSYFLTALMYVLHMVTREEDIVITTINNGRSDIRTMGIMGMFVKTLPVASSAADAKLGMSAAAMKMQDQLLESQSRDFYPFTKLVELYGIRPEIMYVYQPSEDGQHEDQIPLTLNQAKLPITVELTPQRDDYVLDLKYDSDLYSRNDMLQLATMLKRVSEATIDASKLCEIPMLSESERVEIVRLGSMPMKSNEKIHQGELSIPIAQVEETVNAETDLEERLLQIVRELLGNSGIGVTTNLISVGLNSILGMRLSAVIKQKTNVIILTKDILTHPTIREMAAMADDAPVEDEKSYRKRDDYPLTENQRGLYIDWEMHRETTQYNLPSVTKMHDTEAETLRDALVKVVNAHPYLKTHLAMKDGDVVQLRLDDDEAVVDLIELKEEPTVDFFRSRVRPFDLFRDRLYRMEVYKTPTAVWYFQDIHHIIFDGGSALVLQAELGKALQGEVLQTETYTAFDRALDEQTLMQSEQYQEAERYFDGLLEDVEMTVYPHSARPDGAEAGNNAYIRVNVDKKQVDDYSRERSVTASSFFLTVVMQVLHRLTREERMAITTICNGRDDLRMHTIMGMFVKTLPAVSRLDRNQTFSDALQQMNQQSFQSQGNAIYPFTKIAERYKFRSEIMYAFQGGWGTSDMTSTEDSISLELDTAKTSMTFMVNEAADDHYTILIEYNTHLYSHADVTLLAKALQTFAGQVLSGTEKLCDISLVDQEECARILELGKGETLDFDTSKTLVDLFTEQAQKTPDDVCIVYKDIRLTYREVDQITDRLAVVLQCKYDVRPETAVGVMIERSELMLIYPMAVMKAGAAYMPLDFHFPEDRLTFMCQDAGVRLILSEDNRVEEAMPRFSGQVIKRDILDSLSAGSQELTADSPRKAKPDNMFVILYTSGSTGTPKGVILEHRNIVNFCHWYVKAFKVTAKDRSVAYANFGFDAHMIDIYPVISVGGSAFIIPSDMRMDPMAMNEYMEQEQLSLAFLTTQVGCMFTSTIKNHSLRLLSVGGEILPRVTKPAFEFYNVYGPTECTLFSTYFYIDKDCDSAYIGRPLANYQLFVVDQNLNLVPHGAAGELVVAGAGVGRGYLNRPDMNAEKFVTFMGQKAYRTGDLVRWSPDGNIDFLGRIDNQVKLRGFRIELGEIEHQALLIDGIRSAVAEVREVNDLKHLVLYYTVVDGRTIDTKDIRAHLSASLTDYMVPTVYMQMDSMPLTPNGKVNRRVLPQPVIQRSAAYVEPDTDMEKLFCKIFGQVLSVEKVGATDNFFELGGTSLMVTKVVIEAYKANVRVVYGDVFSHPTPRLLAQFVTGKAPATEQETEEECFDYTGINAILQQNNIETFLKGERQQLGNVLLTGATGFLGIHVLRELIASDATTITCLVRAEDQPAAEHRLKSMLFYYFESEFTQLFGNRLFVVNGDITTFDYLTISPLDYFATPPNSEIVKLSNREIVKLSNRQIDTVFNCAANVKHFSKGTDIEDVNIGGALRCVEFCLKTGARLVHISTTSVAESMVDRGDGSEVPRLDERKLWFGQSLDNRYVHSKFQAERLVLDAVAHHGLSAKVMRVGNLAPRNSDGEFQVNFNSNSYMGRLKVFHMLGCCPYDSYDQQTEMSPVDDTAKAVVLLASTPKECTVFQPFNNHTELLGDVLRMMEKVGREMRFVESTEFERAIVIAGQDSEKSKQLSALLAYQNFGLGQKTIFIERDNRYTCSVLHRLGFHWRDTSWDYVERMLTAISGLGFFDA